MKKLTHHVPETGSRKRDVEQVELDPYRTTNLGEKFRVFAKKYLKGQPRLLEWGVHAIEQIETIKNEKISNGEERVAASVLVMGPSGTGKTLIAELIAEFLFGDRKALFKLEGQRFSERHRISVLLTAPPGYVGYDDEPELTQDKLDEPYFQSKRKEFNESRSSKERERFEELELVYQKCLASLEEIEEILTKLNDSDPRKNHFLERKTHVENTIRDVLKEAKTLAPFLFVDQNRAHPSVFLIDEIERAHVSFRNLLYGILEKGSIKISSGEEVSFRGSVVILTSNVALDEVVRASHMKSGRSVEMGFQVEKEGVEEVSDDDLYTETRRRAEKEFTTPFLGRIGKIVLTRMLTEENYADILSVFIQDYCVQLVLELNFPLVVTVEKEAQDFIVKKATKIPEEGARPLKRAFQKYIIDCVQTFKNTKQIQIGDEIKITLSRGEKRPRLCYHKILPTDKKKERLFLNPTPKE